MPNGQHDPSAVELAQEALAGSINNALSFTYQLIEIIQDRVKYTKRHTGPASVSYTHLTLPTIYSV